MRISTSSLLAAAREAAHWLQYARRLEKKFCWLNVVD
jgi:hypothetical protein